MEKCKRMKRQLCMSKNWIVSWLWKSSITRQQCYRSESFAMINGQKPHLIKNGIRIIFNTENFVPIVVLGLSSSSTGSSSTQRTPMKQESHSSSSSSSSSSSPTVGEIQVREREDRIDNDISPVPVSELVDDSSGRPDETQANKNLKQNKKETTIERGNLCDDPEIPEWLQEFGSSIRSRGTGSSYSMDPGVSVQKQNFTRNPEKLAKVQTREETKCHLHWQFFRIRESLWRSFLESLHVCTTQIGD